MGRMDYVAMRNNPAMDDRISSDVNELKVAARRLFSHAAQHGGVHFTYFNTIPLKYFACFAAIYLLILDRTNWRTNLRTSLLGPYVFFNLPSPLFHMLRREDGFWIAFTVVVLRLFFHRHLPDWLDMPGSLILLTVVEPHLFAHKLRHHWIGELICLLIGCYLLQEHIRASGGFKNSLTRLHGISNTLEIVLLIVFPVWELVIRFFYMID